MSRLRLSIDLQKMNWKFRAGFQEHMGVSLKEHMPNNPRGGYTRKLGHDMRYPSAEINGSCFEPRSSWIPGSWHLRMVYTDGIPFHEPSQESNRAGQHHESHR